MNIYRPNRLSIVSNCHNKFNFVKIEFAIRPIYTMKDIIGSCTITYWIDDNGQMVAMVSGQMQGMEFGIIPDIFDENPRCLNDYSKGPFGQVKTLRIGKGASIDDDAIMGLQLIFNGLTKVEFVDPDCKVGVGAIKYLNKFQWEIVAESEFKIGIMGAPMRK
jgi:hypothetical protein